MPVGEKEIVRVDDLCKVFHARGRRGREVQAVRGVSFALRAGSSMGLVGESGSGKTTTARIICGLETATSGTVRVGEYDMHELEGPPPRVFFDDVQMIFQDPYMSLSPRMTIAEAVGYSLRVRNVPRAKREERVRTAIQRVGLPSAVLKRYPHQLSTGQRQRVGIARAIVLEPRLIVADEPVSSLDVSLQTQILNLLVDIQEQTHVSYLFISHDLAVVGYLCDDVVVMKDGVVVERGATSSLLASPETDYTRKLITASGLDVSEHLA
jgi:ABC-type oligopeptide transport system ATPase subunit